MLWRDRFGSFKPLLLLLNCIRVLLCVCLGVIVTAGMFAGSTFAAEQVIYMHPNGSDAADGLSEATPVESLQKALQIASQISGKSDSLIRIAVASGDYKGQAAKAMRALSAIVITSADSTKPRPRFDGNGNGGIWFDLRSTSGRMTHYIIEGLEIVNYETAINLAGDRNRTENSNSGTEIRNNVFVNIGQIARAGAPPSTAVIRLVNSDENVIKGNRFFNVRNSERCGMLHSIYVAHDSTGNIIEGNVFEDSCGDAIRFRDGSHSNVVKDNTFIDAWDKTPVSDWYCDRERRADCTKISGECPSMNNVLENNTVIARKLITMELFVAHGDDIKSNCTADTRGKRFVLK